NESIKPSKNEILKNKMDDFSYRNINNSNVFSLLKDAKAENSSEKIKKCLDFLGEKSLGVKIDLKKGDPISVSIKIEEPTVEFDKLSLKIGQLSQIFDGKLNIELLPTANVTRETLGKFLGKHSDVVQLLDLSAYEYELDDDFINDLNIGDLNNLKALSLSKCEELKLLPPLPDSITTLDLSRMKLETIGDLPANLTTLNLSYSELNNVEKLPNSITKLNLSRCEFDSWNLEGQLENLIGDNVKELDMSSTNLRRLPTLPNSITFLNLANNENLNSIDNLPSNLKTLILSRCENLTKLPELPDSVETLKINLCHSLNHKPKLPENLKHLETNNFKNFFIEKSKTSAVHAMIDALKYAKETDSKNDVRSYIDLIENTAGISINLKETPVSIGVSSQEGIPSDDLLKYINDLSTIFNDTNDVVISFTPDSSFGINNLEKLLQEQGDSIQELDLSYIGDEIDNEAANKIKKLCPNLLLLTIQSNTITDEGLDFSNLKNLKSLIFSGCSQITTVPENLPESIKELKFINCQNLPDTMRFLALSKIFDTDFELGLNSIGEFIDGIDNILKFLGEKLGGEPIGDQQDIPTYFIKALENKLMDQETAPTVYMSLMQFCLQNGHELVQEKESQLTAVLVKSLESRLSNLQNPDETVISLAKIVYDHQENLHLHEEHTLVQDVIQIITLSSVEGPKNPFTVLKNLTELRKESIDFSPPPAVVEGVSVAINLGSLEAMAKGSNIDRSMLPKNATITEFDAKLHALEEKQDAPQMRDTLDKLGTTWDEVTEGVLSSGAT
ncbi:MAG TPA: hypothetical protein VGP47_02065, partial [Parachlamydiaceae bacterium]|nr:hypothetical protein [Parachlamydiaceae bacterium]